MLFAGLAILCDEWLIPHLTGVKRALQMSDDLAGVSIMAFGGAVSTHSQPMHVKIWHFMLLNVFQYIQGLT